MKGQSSFHASHPGRCRGCKQPIASGSNIWSPGKGQGMFHINCQPPVTVRQATPEELERMRASR